MEEQPKLTVLFSSGEHLIQTGREAKEAEQMTPLGIAYLVIQIVQGQRLQGEQDYRLMDHLQTQEEVEEQYYLGTGW